MGHKIAAALLAGALILPAVPAAAQSQAELWRGFAASLEPGAEVKVRLDNGQRFRATFVRTSDDALFVQPKTRVPVPVQPVPYDAIVRLERDTGSGARATRAAVIGVAAGAGTFLGLLLFVLAVSD